MTYGRFGSMKTKPGQRDEVLAILLEAGDGVRAIGCSLYAVGISDTDPDLIRVVEIWESKRHHADSLLLPDVKAAIARAMPMLTGEFTGDEMTIVGGLGV